MPIIAGRDRFASGVHRQGRRDLALTGLLALAVLGLLALYGPLNQGPERWVLRTPVDEHIPLITPFVVPYVSALALVPLSLVIFLARSWRIAQSGLLATVLLLVVAYGCYIFAQTSVPRPEVAGDHVFAELLRMVYANDNNYNCFPSLHTGFSVVTAVHWLWFSRRVGRYVAAWCALIVASTLFVHQHYIADMLGGLVVAGTACWAARALVARGGSGSGGVKAGSGDQLPHSLA